MQRDDDSGGVSPKGPRVIKRYSNRKLYDTQDSRYVTLQQIGAMVRGGDDVRIVDNRTKEDKTEATLALILSEDLKSTNRSVPLGTLRTLIQERGERLLSQLRDGPIGRLIPMGEDDDDEGGDGHSQPPVDEADIVVDGVRAPVPPAGSVLPRPASDENVPRGRLNEMVEASRQTLDQWQHAFDERIQTVVPGVGAIRELREEVARLARRVDALERQLAAGRAADEPESGSAGAR